MKIIILRHGESKGDKLTLKGKRQVKLVIDQLKDFNIQNVYCSPLNRCKQTANIVCKKLNLTYIIDDNLAERWQLGHTPTTKTEQAWWDNYLNKNYIDENFETCNDFIKRNSKMFEKIKKSGQNTLIIAHSATTYALIDYILNQHSNVIWTQIGNANYICFDI